MRKVKIIGRDFLHNGEQYNAGGVVEMEEAAAAFATNSGQAIYTDEPVSPPPSGNIDALAKEKARIATLKPSERKKAEDAAKKLAEDQKLADEDAKWQREQDDKAAKLSREQDEANKKAAAAAVHNQNQQEETVKKAAALHR